MPFVMFVSLFVFNSLFPPILRRALHCFLSPNFFLFEGHAELLSSFRVFRIEVRVLFFGPLPRRDRSVICLYFLSVLLSSVFKFLSFLVSVKRSLLLSPLLSLITYCSPFFRAPQRFSTQISPQSLPFLLPAARRVSDSRTSGFRSI